MSMVIWDEPPGEPSADNERGPALHHKPMSDDRMREVARLINLEIDALGRPFQVIATALEEARAELLRARTAEMVREKRDKLISIALGPDLSGRVFAELLRLVADDCAARGGGPLEVCLREKANVIEAALEATP